MFTPADWSVSFPLSIGQALACAVPNQVKATVAAVCRLGTRDPRARKAHITICRVRQTRTLYPCMQDPVLIQQSSFAAIHLLLQTGASPSHSPLARHLRVLSPTRSNPLLQLYVALEPGTLELGRRTSPFAGSGRLGHTIPACKTQF